MLQHVPAQGAVFRYASPHFHSSQGQVPSLAPILTGQILLDMVLNDAKELEQSAPLVNDALVQGVRNQHLRHLRDFRDWLRLHPAMSSLPLQRSAILFFQEMSTTRRWQWPTLHRSMTSLIGALSNLPLYSNVPHPIRLDRNAPHWAAALKTVQQKSQLSQPRDQTAVSLPLLEIALEQEPRLWVRAALILMWMSSARVGCVLQLEIRDLKFDEKSEELLLVFAHGKGVRFRGPYSRFARMHGPWAEILKEYQRQRRAAASETALLFPATAECLASRRTSVLLAAIRVADPALSMRAMRRGSLQTLSTKAPTPFVSTAAGHTNLRTTGRYLNNDAADRHLATEALQYTEILLPGRRLA